MLLLLFFPVEGPGRLRHQQKGAKKKTMCFGNNFTFRVEAEKQRLLVNVVNLS